MPESLKELLAARARLDVEIAKVRKSDSTEALKTVHELVREYGFTAQQVFPWQPAAPKTRVAKYRDERSGATWTGRGKPPAWIRGRNRDEFLIQRPRTNDGPYLAEMAAASVLPQS